MVQVDGTGSHRIEPGQVAWFFKTNLPELLEKGRLMLKWKYDRTDILLPSEDA